MVGRLQQTDYNLQSKNKSPLQPSESFSLDRLDVLLAGFAFSFFGAILLLIALDTTSPNYSNLVFTTVSKTLSQNSSENIIEEGLPSATLEGNSATSKNQSIETQANNTKTTTSTSSILTKTTYSPTVTTSTSVDIHRSPIAQKGRSVKVHSTTITTAIAASKPTTSTSFKKVVSESAPLKINEQISEDLLPPAYFEAKEKAASEGKLMYIKFGAKWCLPCRTMERTTFKDERVLKFIDENYVALSIDVDDFDGYNLKAYYNVQFLPTLMIFNASGSFVAQYAKSFTPEKMLEMLAKHHQAENRTLKNPPTSTITERLPKATPSLELPQGVAISKIILTKKENGTGISSLKTKGKNWRFTAIELETKNMFGGHLLVQVKEIQSQSLISETKIPLSNRPDKETTTSTVSEHFQMGFSHEKRKAKKGDYAIEIFHAIDHQVKLIEKTTFLKGGKFIWKK